MAGPEVISQTLEDWLRKDRATLARDLYALIESIQGKPHLPVFPKINCKEADLSKERNDRIADTLIDLRQFIGDTESRNLNEHGFHWQVYDDGLVHRRVFDRSGIILVDERVRPIESSLTQSATHFTQDSRIDYFSLNHSKGYSACIVKRSKQSGLEITFTDSSVLYQLKNDWSADLKQPSLFLTINKEANLFRFGTRTFEWDDIIIEDTRKENADSDEVYFHSVSRITGDNKKKVSLIKHNEQVVMTGFNRSKSITESVYAKSNDRQLLMLDRDETLAQIDNVSDLDQELNTVALVTYNRVTGYTFLKYKGKQLSKDYNDSDYTSSTIIWNWAPVNKRGSRESVKQSCIYKNKDGTSVTFHMIGDTIVKIEE